MVASGIRPDGSSSSPASREDPARSCSGGTPQRATSSTRLSAYEHGTVSLTDGRGSGRLAMSGKLLACVKVARQRDLEPACRASGPSAACGTNHWMTWEQKPLMHCSLVSQHVCPDVHVSPVFEHRGAGSPHTPFVQNPPQ